MSHYFDVFLSPVCDNKIAQVLIVALLMPEAVDGETGGE